MDSSQYMMLALSTESYLDGIPERLARQGRLIHGALGVSTEAGELLDALKKHVYYDKPLDTVNVIEEAGDILWYLAIILAAAGSNFDEAMTRNIEKLRNRYPDGFTKQGALERNLEAERKALEGTE